MNPIAVSTWSVDPYLSAGSLTLETLPAELARRGYNRAEICHFHLASAEPAYLASIRGAFREAGVMIQTLLIDDGDITDPKTRDRDIAWIEGWIAAAAALGAEHARVIAGKSAPSPEALALSVDALKRLSKLGEKHGVRIVTENWFALTASPRELHHILDSVGDGLGVLADMGNWDGQSKYSDLSSIFARAELCHAKCHFGEGLDMDREDYGNCIAAALEAGYAGPFTLVFESPGEPWRGIEMEREFLLTKLR
jgi:sugar phosphate isomerase/epimerase